jgi:hypothetical protein
MAFSKFKAWVPEGKAPCAMDQDYLYGQPAEILSALQLIFKFCKLNISLGLHSNPELLDLRPR